MADTPNPNADSDELEALFDQVAAQRNGPPAAKVPPRASILDAVRESGSGDSDSSDLQELFDIVAASAAALPGVTASAAGAWEGQDKAFNMIGQLARQLHDAVRGLGYDKLLEKTMTALPDAKDRLAYVANLTEQAACRVLNATDVAMPLQEQMGISSKALGARWDKVFAGEMGVEDFRQLAAETRAYLNVQVPEQAAATSAQLMEIMMAQDFQDLTGQVIKKIVILAQDMEAQMMQILIEIMPEMKKTEEVNSLLNGPVVNADGRADVVVNQEQVDDLLGSLGF